MCPLDRSPHGGEILHTLPEAPFPQPEIAPLSPLRSGDEKPEEKPEEKPREKPDQGPHGTSAGDIEERPEIPASSELLAADIEDEEADPVVESGPGVDGPPEGRIHRTARELGLLRA